VKLCERTIAVLWEIAFEVSSAKEQLWFEWLLHISQDRIFFTIRKSQNRQLDGYIAVFYIYGSRYGLWSARLKRTARNIFRRSQASL